MFIRIEKMYLKISNKTKPTRKRPTRFFKIKLSNCVFNNEGYINCYIKDFTIRPHRHRPITLDIHIQGNTDLKNGVVSINAFCNVKRNSEVNVTASSYELMFIK